MQGTMILSDDEARKLIELTVRKERLVKIKAELDAMGINNVKQIEANIESLRLDIVSMLTHNDLED